MLKMERSKFLERELVVTLGWMITTTLSSDDKAVSAKKDVTSRVRINAPRRK